MPHLDWLSNCTDLVEGRLVDAVLTLCLRSRRRLRSDKNFPKRNAAGKAININGR